MLSALVKSLPYIGRLHKEIGQLKAELKRWRTWQPPGHYYSPIPSLDEVRLDAERIFDSSSPGLLGIDLDDALQLELLKSLAPFYSELPWKAQASASARYHYENEYYSYADGIVLFSMLRHIRPRRLIEVGSGFSSAIVLDANPAFFDGRMQCSFIEPYPERLMGLMTDDDKQNTFVLEKRVQDIPVSRFQTLEANDFLLIDSSHVSKTGSDLNYLLFEVLPRLQPGVWVHFHDIYYPFEYPRSWVEQGVAWNEAYMLRAFLQFNQQFKIAFFTAYMLLAHQAFIAEHLPLMLKSEKENPAITDCPGSSLWIRKASS